MISAVLKSAKVLDILTQIKNYIVSNYDASCFNATVEKFLTECQQNRNVISTLGDTKQTIDSLKSNRQILIQYINQLNLLKTKMSFGKDKFAIHLEWTWRDTLKNSNWSSFNISFEIYNVLYDLAITYYNIGRVEAAEAGDDDAKLKEAIKAYQYAAGFFDKIKNEAPLSIQDKELPNDLKPNYMTYCSCICIAKAQLLLIKVAEKKKTSAGLLAQLCKGVEDMYKNAQLIAKEKPLCKVLGDQYLYVINNRVNYSQAYTYSKLRDAAIADFEKKGDGYGVCITYQGAIVQCLLNNEKELKKIKVPMAKDALVYEKEKQLGGEMFEKNERIYRNPCPDLANLPKCQQKIMANAAMPPEFKNDVEDARDLDALIPKEVKMMISQYKMKMMDFISQNLNNYETEDTILQFLNSLGLPANLETVLSSASISDSLWRGIAEVQAKGGAMYLQNMMQALQRMPGEIKNRIDNSLALLKNEDMEDQKLRAQYGTKWTRRQSSDLNGNYLHTLEDYKGKLNQAMECDKNTFNDIQNNLRYFELLSLPREQLDQRIPHRVDGSKIKNCPEAMDLRKELDNLDAEKVKAMEIINKVFASLNDDNVAGQFIQVLQQKATENNILDQNKAAYMTMFNELGVISNNIRSIKVNIQSKNEVFMRVKNDKFKPDPANEQFFRELDSYVQLFRTKELNLQQGLNFYKQFDQKLNELNRNITDFLMARDMDKNELIKYVTMGQTYNENKNIVQDLAQGFWDFTKTAASNVAGFVQQQREKKNNNTDYSSSNSNNQGGYNNQPSGQNNNWNQNQGQQQQGGWGNQGQNNNWNQNQGQQQQGGWGNQGQNNNWNQNQQQQQGGWGNQGQSSNWNQNQQQQGGWGNQGQNNNWNQNQQIQGGWGNQGQNNNWNNQQQQQGYGGYNNNNNAPHGGFYSQYQGGY